MAILFEEKERTYQGYRTYIESEFDFLDRSARNEFSSVRNFLNQCLEKIPESDAIDIVARIKSRDKRSFDSATFEIVVFTLLSNLGCEITVHPELNNGSDKRPDFFVVTPNGMQFYLEVVLASEYSKAERSAESRRNVVLAAIEDLESPNFFVGITADGNPNTPPPGRVLKRELSRWLSSLDPDLVIRDVEEGGNDRIPEMEWEHDGWSIKFDAIPIRPERRGMGQRIIGMVSGGARLVNVWEPIRDAVREKGRRYGDLGKPFIVAVNVDGLSLDRIDEMQALFGQEEFVFNSKSPETGPEMRRAPNGLWLGKSGPQYTRVSGVWIFGELHPWNIVTRRNTLYLNPWTKYPFPDELKVVRHAMPVHGNMEWYEGVPLAALLNLSDTWPD